MERVFVLCTFFRTEIFVKIRVDILTTRGKPFSKPSTAERKLYDVDDDTATADFTS